jgi:SAM-dependent methyltransferase
LGDNYTQSFGEQWSQFSKTQIDSYNGSNLSEERFFEETGWSIAELKNAVVLDLGCGSGRFTEVASRYSKFVIAVDLSSAIFAFPDTLVDRKNVLRIHGDIRHLPLNYSKITHVFSIGVLQHTPNPYQTLELLIGPLAPETKFAFTAYGKKWFTKLQAKYVLRPMTKRMDRRFLLSSLKLILQPTYRPLLFISGIPIVGKIVKFILPFSIYPEFRDKLKRDQIFEFMLLDSFDALSPSYDNPLSLKKSLRIVRQFSKEILSTSKTPMIINGIRK